MGSFNFIQRLSGLPTAFLHLSHLFITIYTLKQEGATQQE